MTPRDLPEKAAEYLQRLCVNIASRTVGSQGNEAATDFFSDTMSSFDFDLQSQTFECIAWSSEGAILQLGTESFRALSSPYSVGCQVSAPLAVASSLQELEAACVSNQILLLRGELTREQLMPKNFPFYNPEEHRRIIHLLEEKKPRAIIAATSRDAVMAGGVYPFPLIEDGDFDIPSAYVSDEEGTRLLKYSGCEVWLESKASRRPARGRNVIARKGGHPHRIVFFAHIDAKNGTAGALDNASGIVILLLLAELLRDYSGQLGVEIVALNGEDYYSNPGEQLYLLANANRFSEIVLGVNLDGVGYRFGNTAYSMYGCPLEVANLVRACFALFQDIVEGQPWYQGDHSLFLMNQRPALAITSGLAAELLAEVIHTPLDNPAIVEPTKLVEVATALRDLTLNLDQLPFGHEAD